MIVSHSTKMQRLVDWLLIFLSKGIRVDGLWVGAFSEERGAEMLGKIGEALELIKTHDPYRYRRVLKEFDRIWVHLLPGQVAIFVPTLRRCVIDPRFVLSYSPEDLASTIVHEATHGELIRRKVGYPEALRQRIEKICVRQQLAFVRKLPHGDEARREVERYLAVPPDFWSDEAFRIRRGQGEPEMLRYAGFPNWLIRAFTRLREKREQAVASHRQD